MESQQSLQISFAASRLTHLFKSIDFTTIQELASHFTLSFEPILETNCHRRSMASLQLSVNDKSSQKALNIKLSENYSTPLVTNRNDHTFYVVEKPTPKPKSNGFRINMIRNSDKISIRSSDKIVNNDVVIPALASSNIDSIATTDAGCSAWPTCSVNKRVGARSFDGSENRANGRDDKNANGFAHEYNYRANDTENFRRKSKAKVSFEQSLSSADAFYSTNAKNGKRRLSLNDQNGSGLMALNLDLSENLASPVKAGNQGSRKLTAKSVSHKRTSRRSANTSPSKDEQSMPVLLKPDPIDDSNPLNLMFSPSKDEENAMEVNIDAPFLDVDVLYDFDLGFDETAYYEKLVNDLTRPCRIFLEKSEPLPVAVYNKQYQRGPAGYYHDHLFVDCHSECVFCCKCKQMLSLLVFVTHSHGQRKLWKSINQEFEETSIPDPQLFMFVKNASKDRFDLWCRLCDKVRRFDALPHQYMSNSIPEKLASAYADLNRRSSLFIGDNLSKKYSDTNSLNVSAQCNDETKAETSSKIPSEMIESSSVLTDLFPNLVTDDISLLDTDLTTIIIPDPIEIDNVVQDTAEILLSLSRNGQSFV